MNSIRVLQSLLFSLILCNAEIVNERLTYDTKIVEEIKKEVKREILLPLIGGLKTALNCDCGSEETCPCLSGLKPDICLTEGCVRTAASVLSMMNSSADPCEDFFEFTCGKWIEETRDDRKRYSLTFAAGLPKEAHKYIMKEMEENDHPEAVRKFLKAYQQCVNYEELLPSLNATIMGALNHLQMPLLKKDWKEDDYNWIESLVIAFHNHGISLPLGIDVIRNPYNISENIFSVDVPSSASYERLTFTSIYPFGLRYSENSNNTVFNDVIDMQNLVEFVLDISKKYGDVEEDPEETKLITIGELNKLFPSVDWLTLFQNLYDVFLKPIGYSITNKDRVQANGISAISDILEAINTGKIRKRVLANYIASTHLNKVVTVHSLHEKLTSAEQQSRCFEYFMSNIPYVIDYIYGKHRKDKTMDPLMTKYLTEAMHELVVDAKWLDSETREKVHEKLYAMKEFLNFAPFSQDASKLDKFYEELPEMTNNTFENELATHLFERRRSFQRIAVQNNREEWYQGPQPAATQFQAFNYRSLNHVYLPAGIQIYPYFLADRPQYINFGGMGLIVGHEITHSLDKTGYKRDKYGNLRNWWTEKAKKQFDESSECFVQQYNSYEYGGETNQHVNGIATLSENIADNGGIRQSYLAYQIWEKNHGRESSLPGLEKYSAYQMFFLSVGNVMCASLNPEELYQLHKNDDHAPDKFRVMGPLSNMDEFAEAFNCKKGSKMNPEKKCVIW